MKKVPNVAPKLDLGYKVAIVGSHATPADSQGGLPFSGPGGKLLDGLLTKIGLTRSACYVGLVGAYPPPGGDLLKAWGMSHDIVQQGLTQLRYDMLDYDPDLVILLGQAPLYAAGIEHPIDDFRGSLFISEALSSPFFGRKCIATYDPHWIIKGQSEKVPLMVFDFKRAKEEASTKTLHLPYREFEIDLSADQIVDRLQCLPKHKPIAIDIEGRLDKQGVTCISLAKSKDEAFIIPFFEFDEEGLRKIMPALAYFLRSPDYQKVLQNGLYDNFVLSWEFKMFISNIVWDTMLSGWEIYPELPKGLGVQTSLYTREPYYKNEGRIDNRESKLRYCCKDSAVTLEIAEYHSKILEGDALNHYMFNLRLTEPVMYMQLKGLKYNQEAADQARAELEIEMDIIQTRIDKAAQCSVNCNASSGKNSLQNILYERMKFAPIYKIENGKKTNKTTADINALLRLLKQYDSDFIYDIMVWKNREGIRQQLSIQADRDGRVRGNLNVVGTDTGRWSCQKSPTLTGMNLQTAIKQYRHCFTADDGYDFGACDLEGADGWTVAAYSKMLGDSTMFDDLSHGIKPAMLLVAMYLYGETLADLPGPDLMGYLEAAKADQRFKALYAVSKAVQHGSSYGMGIPTMQNNVTLQSWKKSGSPLYASAADCKKLQDYFFRRYRGVKEYQKWVANQIDTKGSLPCASGHVRKFWGPKRNNETYKSAYSHMPQHNTSYAISLAILNLWLDEENRRPDGSIIIEPLLQVHDEFCVQWPTEVRDWAVPKMRTYFNNELTIADTTLVIPYEGGYGRNWRDLTEGKI